MSSLAMYCLNSLPLAFLLTISFLPWNVNGTGMPPASMCGCGCAPPAPPPPPPPPPCGCCCGGRKKREAVQPLMQGKETPCPQTEWRELIRKAMISSDDIGSVNSIQTALFLRFPDRKFIVMCALAGNNTGPLQNQVHLSASGDGYCNVVNERLWCQAAAIVA